MLNDTTKRCTIGPAGPRKAGTCSMFHVPRLAAARQVKAAEMWAKHRRCGQIPFEDPTFQLSEKYHGCLGYIGDYTTQLYGDCIKPL